jgi:hypothetical protein
MTAKKQSAQAVFRVIDAMDAPYVGRILRLRLQEGEAPSIRRLKGARLLVRSPEGDEQRVRVLGFPILGGKPSDARLSRTGKISLHVEAEEDGDAPPVSLGWEASLLE